MGGIDWWEVWLEGRLMSSERIELPEGSESMTFAPDNAESVGLSPEAADEVSWPGVSL